MQTSSEHGMTSAIGDRVRARSAASVNERLDLETEARLSRLRGASATEIGHRLGELDREWNIDRALMMFFSFAGGLTFGLGLWRTMRRKKVSGLLYFLAVQMGFIGVHAAYGWCPPVALLRRFGFRTDREIDAERRALEGSVAAPAPETHH